VVVMIGKIEHPWWHWFFTSLKSWGTMTILSPDEPKYDTEEWYCSKCDKWFKFEKKRNF